MFVWLIACKKEEEKTKRKGGGGLEVIFITFPIIVSTVLILNVNVYMLLLPVL